MKIKKNFSFKSKNQIWRLLISDSDYLVVETRNMDTREVYFSCVDIVSGKNIFDNIQLEEKSWIGIETIYKDIIFFHQYAKPDMPDHRRISAFDINLKKELWKNDEFTFGFVLDDVVYAKINTMLGEKYFPIDYNSGEIISEESVDSIDLLELRTKYENGKDYSHYKFPEIYNLQYVPPKNISDYVIAQTKGINIVGNVEYIEINDLLMMNYHYNLENEFIRNEFVVVNQSNGKKIYSETLNKKAKAFVPDSFFVYKDKLFLLKEKNEVIIGNIIGN